MTVEEAIKEFRERIEFGKKEYLKYIPEYIEAYEMAHREITFGTDVYFDSNGLISIEGMEDDTGV